jgi:hypothetical protein
VIRQHAPLRHGRIETDHGVITRQKGHVGFIVERLETEVIQ